MLHHSGEQIAISDATYQVKLDELIAIRHIIQWVIGSVLMRIRRLGAQSLADPFQVTNRFARNCTPIEGWLMFLLFVFSGRFQSNCVLNERGSDGHCRWYDCTFPWLKIGCKGKPAIGRQIMAESMDRRRSQGDGNKDDR